MVTACATAEIPNVNFYREIPFIDAPEGMVVESLTHKTTLLTHEEWMKIKPILTCTDPEGIEKIMNQWYEACRQVGQNCNAQIDSVRKFLKVLDDIARGVIK